jgi:hypothetical protein
MSKKSKSHEQQGQVQSPKPNPDQAEKKLSDGGSSGISVIGLGGSAGSLECFKNFFSAMQQDTDFSSDFSPP